MSAFEVEAILVIRYLKEVHNETYGRGVTGGGYSKDYIQLTRSADFLADMDVLFPPVTSDPAAPRVLVFEWPGAVATGSYVPRSADRPHLKWETKDGTPAVWKMTLTPSQTSVETIPGDPDCTTSATADAQFSTLAEKGAGQPYLLAIKLRGQDQRLHLRAYLDGPAEQFSYASLSEAVPDAVLNVAHNIPAKRVLGWRRFDEDEQVYFDPARRHDSWPTSGAARFADDDDVIAEALPSDPAEEQGFEIQLESADYGVEDQTATVKTRGSAQRVFANAVKKNYGHKCAVTGISSGAFLVASHIVPWSEDATIRLDPSNGICLSLLIDRAFENGYIRIEDDLSIHLDQARIGNDESLRTALEIYEGAKLTPPAAFPPSASYLKRRRDRLA